MPHFATREVVFVTVCWICRIVAVDRINPEYSFRALQTTNGFTCSSSVNLVTADGSMNSVLSRLVAQLWESVLQTEV